MPLLPPVSEDPRKLIKSIDNEPKKKALRMGIHGSSLVFYR